VFTGMSHNSCIEQRSNQQSSQLLIIDQVEQIMLKTGAKLQRVKKGFCVECEVLVDYDHCHLEWRQGKEHSLANQIKCCTH